MILLEGLTKKYGDFEALSGLDLEIQEGSFYGFLGPNGAGKTTTVKIMSGLLHPTSGRAVIGGYDILTQPMEAKKIIGFIPDRPHIYEKLTAAEFLRFISRLFKLSPSVTEDRIDEYLSMFALSDWKNELLEGFSHGMRQKVIMAAALIHEPRVIIVDEPMVGLDPRGAKLVKEIFRSLCRKGATIFMSTHSLPVAEELCDRIGIIRKGNLIAEGSIEELRDLARNDKSSALSGLEDIFLTLTGESEHTESERVEK